MKLSINKIVIVAALGFYNAAAENQLGLRGSSNEKDKEHYSVTKEEDVSPSTPSSDQSSSSEKKNTVYFGNWLWNPSVKLLPYKGDLADPAASVGWTDRTLFHTANGDGTTTHVNATYYAAAGYMLNGALGRKPSDTMKGADHEPVAAAFEFSGDNGNKENVVTVSWNTGGEGRKIFIEDPSALPKLMKEVFRDYSPESVSAFVFGFEETWVPMKKEHIPFYSEGEDETKALVEAAMSSITEICPTCGNQRYEVLETKSGIGNSLSGVVLYNPEKVGIPNDVGKFSNLYSQEGYKSDFKKSVSSTDTGWGCEASCKEFSWSWDCTFNACTKGAISFHLQMKDLGYHSVFATTLHLPSEYGAKNAKRRAETLAHVKSEVERTKNDGNGFTHIMSGDFNFRMVEPTQKNDYKERVVVAMKEACLEAYPVLSADDNLDAECTAKVNGGENLSVFTEAVEDKLLKNVLYPRDEWSISKRKKAFLELPAVTNDLYDLKEPFEDEADPSLPYPSYKMIGSQ